MTLSHNLSTKILSNAFNEGIRLKQYIFLQQRLFKRRVRYVSADGIYGINANRKFYTKHEIYTSFVPKGRPAKDEKERKILRATLNRERATRLEASFGTQKFHYSLLKIQARKQPTEVLWIFFGIHTAKSGKDDREDGNEETETNSLNS